MRISRLMSAMLAAGTLVLSLGSAASAAITIDGTIDGEWAGATVKQVLYNPSAPIGNFGTPTNENHTEAYDIYTKGDATNFYVGLKGLPGPGQSAAGLFANLYFDTNPPAANGSDLGFEVTNDNAFIPGVPGNYGPITGAGVVFAAAGTLSGPHGIEVAIPWTFFTTDPLSMGFPLATPGSTVTLRLSQTFGYSVAGGATYGDDRLGTLTVPAAAVPEASSVLVFGIVGLAMAVMAKSRVLQPIVALLK